jgi:hypothetical protein
MSETVETQKGQWSVVELFGHKMIAGLAMKDESFGGPMLRVDIPAVDGVPSFTEFYNLTAIYGLHPVSEQVARATAEQVRHTPILVYSPDLITRDDHDKAMQEMRSRLESMRKQLTSGEAVPGVADEIEELWEDDEEDEYDD